MRAIEVTIHHAYAMNHVVVQTVMKDVEADLQLFSKSEVIPMTAMSGKELPEAREDKFFNVYGGYIMDSHEAVVFDHDDQHLATPMLKPLSRVIREEIEDARAGWLEDAVELPVKAA